MYPRTYYVRGTVMEKVSAQEIVSGISQIGALPQTLAAVLKVLNNPQAGAKEIADVISSDVSLTTLVLKMVNSAHYGRHRRIARISEAVTVMGVNSLKVLTLSSTVFSLMNRKDLAEKQSIKRICRHLIEVAATARRIAEESKHCDPEEAFVAGMLHDAGIIIMILYFQEKYFDLISNLSARRIGFMQAERQTFGCTHAEVGGLLIDSWKLPKRLVFVAEQHHNIDAPRIIPEDASLNDIIALADRITLGPFDEFDPDIEKNIEFNQTLTQRLKLTDESLNQIRKDSIVQSIKLAKYLDLDTGDLIDILADANSKLAELHKSLEKIYKEKQDLQKQLSGDIIRQTASV